MIKKILINIAFKLLPGLKKSAFHAANSDVLGIIDEKYGYRNSFVNRRPLDKENNPLPWFTYPAIEYLSQLDLSQKDVLEWGSGNSSLFFAKRVKSIVSIESDKNWFEEISKQKYDNQEIIFSEIDNYEEQPKFLNKRFDVVIIDGKKRYECAKVAGNYINEGGIIILDNSDWYKNSARTLRKLGLIQVDFSGFGPINNYTWTTSVFFMRSFNFTAYDEIQPKNSLGGIANVCD
ncbi:MAG: hypothetical protein OHK0053_23590 [Microscillaceae bacterium]